MVIKTSKDRIGLASLATIIAATVAAQPALAQEASSSLSVSATVTESCVVSTSPVAFGNADVTSGASIDGSGAISVTCTSGTAWEAAAGLGAGTDATLASRKMVNGANLLNYGLYTDEARTNVWGDGVDGATAIISDTGQGTAQEKTIYGRIPAGQTSLPSGSYADTVTVTVTY